MRKVLGLVSILVAITGFIVFFKTFKGFDAPDSQIPSYTSNTTDPVIVAAGDISCNYVSYVFSECQQEKTANLVEKINPDAVLTLGDLQYEKGGLEDFYKFYDKSWGKFKDKTYPALGNHEYLTKDARGYFGYFPKFKNYYSFNLGDWHLISLDSNKFDTLQIDWLKQDLLKNSSKCSLAFYHHPLFSSGKHGPNDIVKPVWEILSKNGVDLVLNGHDHFYERFFARDGITQFIVGTGGRNLYSTKNIDRNSQVRNNKNFGVLKLILHKDSFDWEFISINASGFKESGFSNCR